MFFFIVLDERKKFYSRTTPRRMDRGQTITRNKGIRIQASSKMITINYIHIFYLSLSLLLFVLYES